MQLKNNVEIGLGTVHLGIPYGVRAQDPLMEKETVFSILSCAVQAGIHFFDTAAAYGEAEARLGDFGLSGNTRIEISSKIPPAPPEIYQNETRYIEFVKSAVEKSLKILRAKSLGLIQFHQCEVEFLEKSAITKAIDFLLTQNLATSVGISVYHPEEALAAVEIPGMEAIQIPMNLLDQRFVQAPILKKIKTKRLIARSIFLQGLLVSSAPLPASNMPETLKSLKNKALKIAASFETSLEDLALQYVFKEVEGVSVALLGVDSLATLKQNLRAIQSLEKSSGKLGESFKALAEEASQKGLNDPRRWKSFP